MCLWASKGIQNCPQIVLADIITEGGSVCLIEAHHQAAAFIIMAVIILVNGAVAPICVPGLPVSIIVVGILRIKGFIILEHGVFALPRPDPSRKPLGFSLRAIIPAVHLPGRPVRYIVLHQRLITVHHRNRIPACVLDIIVLDYNIRRTIFGNILIGNLHARKLAPERRIAYGYPPAVCIDNAAPVNQHIIETRNAGLGRHEILCPICFVLCLCIMRHIDSKVNAAVVHMFVINIADHIMDIQVLQMDMVNGAFVLRYGRHASTIHHINCIIHCVYLRVSVDNLQILDFYVLAVVQQDGRRYVSLVLMPGIIQPVAIILEPYALPIRINDWIGACAISVNHNRMICTPTLAEQMQISVFKYGAALQKNLISRF